MDTAGAELLTKILVVDDDEEIASFIGQLLVSRGCTVLTLSDPLDSSVQLRSFGPHVCILDFRMPGRTGAELLDIIKQYDSQIEVIFLTDQDETSLAVDLMKRGASDFLVKPVQLEQVLASVSRAVEHRRLVIENDNYQLHLEQQIVGKTRALNEALASLKNVHSATLEALSMALDFRDQSTSGHSRRVAELTAGAASSIGIRGGQLVQIEHGALLHDVGKLKIPDSILWKPSQLTDDEWMVMRRHPEYGYAFLNNVEFLKEAAEIVYSHHEKYDGTGYPRHLGGANIPIGARLFAIVDAVDAMIYERPYHKPVLFRDAAAEVRRCAGTQFDPSLVESTLAYLNERIPAHFK
jgi:putative nucleotidyltransferase with HDIG domain